MFSRCPVKLCQEDGYIDDHTDFMLLGPPGFIIKATAIFKVLVGS